MGWSARCAKEAMTAKARGDHTPHSGPSHGQTPPTGRDADRNAGKGADGRVVSERWSLLNPLPIEIRVLLVEQGVELALSLLPDADSPPCGPHRMHDDGTRDANHSIP